MLKRLVKIVGGDPNRKEINRLQYVVDGVNALEAQFEELSDEALAQKTDEFRNRLSAGETLDDILIEAFATVREASKRTIGLRHYDVQLIGGTILHQGKIVEMKTGEGKTLVATLPIYLNALTGKGTHLVTVNDYLARRDARWMAPIYDLLGLSVGVLQMAARTENGKKAFIVDLEKESPHEDQHQLRMVPRKEAYLADITYGTNSEFGFDYLRDNMTMRWDDRVQRGHHYAIIDEVDNVLIDEARTPLIISGPAQDQAEQYIRMAQVVKALRPEDYEISEKDRTITLTELGEMRVEQMLGMSLGDPDRPEDITPEQARTLGYLEQALRAQYLFKRNKDYLVQGGKVIIIDEYTGRLMPGRRWSDGLHQAVEAKESVRVRSESVTYATITLQNYFRMYQKLAGMTGTAVTEAEEFDEIYKLEVLPLPTNLEYQASLPDSNLKVLEAKDDSGYKYTYYTYADDPTNTPVFWKRKDYPDVVYRTEEAKLRAIATEILRYNVLGRPLLVGTTSVELSELVSRRLKADPLKRLCQVLLLRKTWFEKNNLYEDGRQVTELQFLNEPLNKLQTAKMRSLARELGISFNPVEEKNVHRLLHILNIPPEKQNRLIADLQSGVPHQVLNARKHTEESQIIAGAGAYGAVMIATNMAGRGVDIKLGGEIAEEILAAVNRVLRRAGYHDPYDMTLEERYQAVQSIDPQYYGIYEAEIKFFLNYIQEMEAVRELGGLHVIGSERHDARRIDNQLRGRAARQGDPGSSRFYLSMQDELMRLFGGGQAESLMDRLKIDDAMPLEAGIVNRIVEQAQTRVEGANFDVRKHLLEYDDVLNTQREKIYEQRDRIFLKDDLSDDVSEMLATEVNKRVPEALENEGEAWKLLAWLDQIQPPITGPGFVYPSYTLRLIYDNVIAPENPPLDKNIAIKLVETIASHTIDAEEDHTVQIVNDLLLQTQMRLDQQLVDRMDTLDIFFDNLYLDEEENVPDATTLTNEITGLVQVPIKLNQRQAISLIENPDEIYEDIKSQVENYLVDQSITRLIGAVERRLEEPLDLDRNSLPRNDWDKLSDELTKAVSGIYKRRKNRYLGELQKDGTFAGGSISKDLNKILSKVEQPINTTQLYQLLIMMQEGTRATFDKKTHRRKLSRTIRLRYFYYASHFLEDSELEEITENVLEQLEGAQDTMRKSWGLVEWQKVANVKFTNLNQATQRRLISKIGEQEYNSYSDRPMITLPKDQQIIVIDVLGNQALTTIYRQLLLSVITELWVDYLTQMEALRVSIGLEAYAQRDPLVQYKNKAFELYQELLNNVRSSVINRMFTFRPQTSKQSSITFQEADQSKDDTPALVPEEKGLETIDKLPVEEQRESIPAEITNDEISKSQKRRRKRRKKK
jgi:preprotein translocase subunit SecA